MNFQPIEAPELSLLGDSASHIISVAPVSMAPFATQLLVEITYIDSSKSHKSYYIYDTEAKLYITNISDYLGGIDVVDITSIDVAWSAALGVTFAIVYIDKSESSYLLSTSVGNRIAVVQNDTLIDNDIIETISGEVSNAGIDNIFIDTLGKKVVFSSVANNLVNYSDTNESTDVFLLDITNTSLQRVSQLTNDDEGSSPSYALGISTANNATKVLIETVAPEFSVDDLNEKNDLYLVVPNSVENTVSLVSKTTNNEASSIKNNQAIIVKDTIVYVSDSDDLVAGDANQSQDIFIQNTDTGSLQRLTANLDSLLDGYGLVEYELLGLNASISQLMFSSNYTNTDLVSQIYRMDLSDNSIAILSQTPGEEVGNDTSIVGVMDSSGTNYAFQTEATNLVETPEETFLVTDIEPSVQLFDVSQNGITNLSLDLYKDGSSLDKAVVVDSAGLLITEIVEFDVVKIKPDIAYNQNINISDAIDVLRHIVDLEAFTPGSAGFHAADVDNNGSINITDAIDILRHIVDLEAIDTFDIIDASGNRVTTLDANASGDAPTWTIVANGDADLSGDFANSYLVTSDLV